MTLITKVIQRYYPDWEPPDDSGKEWIKAVCPFHGDSTASAGISYRYNAFRCLACQIGGSAVRILKEQEGVTYAEAKSIAERLSEGSDIAVPPGTTRQRSRRVFAEQGVVVDQRVGRQVPSGIRGRTAPWT